MPKTTVPKELREILEPETVAAMIEKAPRPMDKALIAVYYIFGVRRNEPLNMRKDNLWMDSSWLYFRVKREKVPKGKVLPRIDTLKVSLDTPFLHYLVGYWATLEGDIMFNYHPNPRTASCYAYNMIKKADNNVWTHLFRHTRAERFRAAGFSDAELMAWFGWTDARTPSNYTHPSTKTIEDMGSAIE